MTFQPRKRFGFDFSWQNLQHDFPSSLVVFLVALPLCMGVAIASGVPVSAGLVTGIIGGLVAGTLAGSPLQVSGPAAGLTVLVYQFVQEHGIEMLGPAVLMAGGLQLLAAAMHLGQWFRAVSPAVIQGMLAGIGVLILAGQFHVMIDDKPYPSGLQNIITIPNAIVKSFSGIPIGTAEERDVRTAQLRQLGELHLKQEELAERVHHLLGGSEGEPSTPKPPAKKSRSRGPKPATPEGEVAMSLEQLAGPQAEIVARVRTFHEQLASDASKHALAETETALTALEDGDGLTARAAQDNAEKAIKALRDSRKSHRSAAMIGALTILLILAWQSIPGQRVKMLPAPLVAVGIATFVAVGVSLPVVYVEVPDNLLDEIYLPTLTELRNLLRPVIMLGAVEIAVIASAETLLCASAVDKLHRGPRTRFDQELGSQGVGNMVCGMLGALPMTGVIVRSSANVNAGARTRLSSVLHGVWILILVAFFSQVLRLIPTASLAAVLVYTGYKLVNIKAVKQLWRHGRYEVVIYLGTLITIVAVDLLTGVLVGIGLAVAKLIYVLSHLELRLEHVPDEKRTVLELRGSATFLRLPALAEALESVPPGNELHVNVEQLDHIDHAALDLLHQWELQNAAHGSKLTLDRESLAARFWRRVPPTSDNGAPVEIAPRRVRQVPI